jgi:uncharacterized protein
MQGMSAATGKMLSQIEHLRQSVRDVLTTRIGTRVMRRDYGSRLPELVDRPMSEMLLVDLYAETVIALERWEPRIKIDRVMVEQMTDTGRIVIGLTGRTAVDGETLNIEGILL